MSSATIVGCLQQQLLVQLLEYSGRIFLVIYQNTFVFNIDDHTSLALITKVLWKNIFNTLPKYF